MINLLTVDVFFGFLNESFSTSFENAAQKECVLGCAFSTTITFVFAKYGNIDGLGFLSAYLAKPSGVSCQDLHGQVYIVRT